jgi:hypothetical protein
MKINHKYCILATEYYSMFADVVFLEQFVYKYNCQREKF